MLRMYPEASAVEQKSGISVFPRDAVMIYSSDGKVVKNCLCSSILWEKLLSMQNQNAKWLWLMAL